MKRKLLSLLLCVCLLAALLPAVSLTADAKTFSEVVAWMDSKNGKALDYDGNYGAQCVDYFNYYLKEVWGISNPIGAYPVQYAYQIFDYNAPSGWTKISGSGNYRVGDIVIWKGGTTGHVGIVYSTSGTVKISQQNYNGMKYVTVQNIHSEGNIRGVFRPPLTEDNPVVAPTPSTTQNILPGTYRLQNKGSGYYMNYAVGGLSGVSGYKPIIMSKPDDSPEQNFRFQYNGNGKYSLMITHSDGGAVNVYSSTGVSAGNAISQWSYSGSDYQQFYITKVTGGYILQSAMDSRLVIAPVSTDWHAQLKLATYNESDEKQIWVLDYPTSVPFQDVDTSGYYMTALRWAYYTGIVSGTSDTTFSPKKTCTRAESIMMLWKAMGSPSTSLSSVPFTDVKSSAYYYKALCWAYEKGITSGTSNTTFSPKKDVTRAEIVTQIWKSKGSPTSLIGQILNPFTDVPSDSYYYKAVVWAYAAGVCSGTTATTFSPKQSCTRAQLVTFLYNAFHD